MVTLSNFVAEQSNPECPPEDIYTLELKEIGELEERQSTAFNANDPDDINTQSKFTFQIVDYDFDPDEDDRDWNGFEVFEYPVFYRRKVGQPVEKNGAVFKSERANAYKLLTALGFDIDSGENIDLGAAIGRRIKSTLKPKKSGWPKIESPAKARQRRRKAAPVVEDDGAFDDE